MGGGGYYAAISMWRWYLHVFVGSCVSFVRSPYRRAFVEECTGVSLCTLWYMAFSTGTVCPVAKGKVTNI